MQHELISDLGPQMALCILFRISILKLENKQNCTLCLDHVRLEGKWYRLEIFSKRKKAIKCYPNQQWDSGKIRQNLDLFCCFSSMESAWSAADKPNHQHEGLSVWYECTQYILDKHSWSQENESIQTLVISRLFLGLWPNAYKTNDIPISLNFANKH